MNGETLAMAAGVLLSLGFRYLPGLAPWYDMRTKEEKSLLMGGLILLTGLGIFGLSCAGWLDGLWPGLSVTCDQAGLQGMIRNIVFALISNQATFLISPKPGYVARMRR